MSPEYIEKLTVIIIIAGMAMTGMLYGLFMAIDSAIKKRRERKMNGKKGRWQRPKDATKKSYRFQCSECGKIVYQVTGDCARQSRDVEPKCTYKYCPWCKADMRGRS